MGADTAIFSSPEGIIEAVAAYFNLTAEALCGKSRVREIADARHIAMYLLREDAHQITTVIGRDLGGRDHSTVIHGLRKVSALASQPEIRAQIAEIRALCSGRPVAVGRSEVPCGSATRACPGLVAAFDVALWRTGYAVMAHDHVLAGGSIGGSPRRPNARAPALFNLYERALEVLREWKPAVVILERPGRWARGSWRSSQVTVEAMALARGVVMAAAGSFEISCIEMDVGEARQQVLGDRTAGKDRVQFALRALGVPILKDEVGQVDEDYCDAALLALAWRWREEGLDRLARTVSQGR